MTEKLQRVGLVVLVCALVGLVAFAADRIFAPAEKLTVVSITGPTSDPAEMDEMFGPILEYLSSELGVEVEMLNTQGYATAIEALSNGTADIARLGPFSYLQAQEQAEAILMVREIEKGLPYYQGQIIARPGIFEEPYNLADLAGHSVAFVEPTSTSGYLVSLAMMKDAGVSLEDLGETYFAGSHPACIEAVLNGVVDVCTTCDRRVNAAVEEGIAVEGENFVTLALSPEIALNPWAASPELDPELRDEITELLLNLPQEVLDASEPEGFVVAVDEDYDFVRAIAAEMED